MSKVLYDHNGMKLCEDKNQEAFAKMDEDAVIIVALNENHEVLLISEESIAYQVLRLALPIGKIEAGELPENTANRKLQEEVGYCAGQLEYIGLLHPSFKYLQWQCHIYLARNLERSSTSANKSVPNHVQPILFDSIEAYITNKLITDATSIAALLLVQKHLLLEMQMHSFNTVFVSS